MYRPIWFWWVSLSSSMVNKIKTMSIGLKVLMLEESESTTYIELMEKIYQVINVDFLEFKITIKFKPCHLLQLKPMKTWSCKLCFSLWSHVLHDWRWCVRQLSHNINNYPLNFHPFPLKKKIQKVKYFIFHDVLRDRKQNKSS